MCVSPYRFHESLGKTEWATKADTDAAPSDLSATPHSYSVPPKRRGRERRQQTDPLEEE